MDIEDEGWDTASEVSMDGLEGHHDLTETVARGSAPYASAGPVTPADGMQAASGAGASNASLPTVLHAMVGGVLPSLESEETQAVYRVVVSTTASTDDSVFLRLDGDSSSQIGADGTVDSNTESFMSNVIPSRRRVNPRFEKYKQQLLQSCRRELARNSILARLSAAYALHRTHLTMHVSSLVQRSSAACNGMLQSALLSTMPMHLLDVSKRPPVPGAQATLQQSVPRCITLEHTGTLLRWFCSRFETAIRGQGPAAPPPDHVTDADWLLGLAMYPLPPLTASEYEAYQAGHDVRRKRPAVAADFVQLFVACVRSLGVPCRLALMADPFDVAGFMQGKVAQARREATEITKQASVTRNSETRQVEVSFGAGDEADEAAEPNAKRGRTVQESPGSKSDNHSSSKTKRAPRRAVGKTRTAATARVSGQLALGSRRRQAEALVQSSFEAASERWRGAQAPASDLRSTAAGASGEAAFSKSSEVDEVSSSESSGSGRKAPKTRKRMRPGAMPHWRRLLPNPSRAGFMEDLAAAGVVRWWAEVLCCDREQGRDVEPSATSSTGATDPRDSSANGVKAADIGAKPRWVPVDPIRMLVDTPGIPAALRSKTDPVTYVIAASGSGRLSDVSRRYASSWPDSRAVRDKSGVGAAEMSGLLRAFEPPDAHPHPPRASGDSAARAGDRQGERGASVSAARGGGSAASTSQALASVEQLEAQELHEAEKDVPLPTSASEFKKHPVYALESQLLRSQVIRPGAKPVSLFKGKGVYYRRDVADCLSKDKWMQLHARVLKESYVDKPAVVVKYKPRNRRLASQDSLSSSSSAAAAADGEEERPRGPVLDADGRIPLPHYGIWQTTEYYPPRIENGIVPKNDFGNVELWNDKCMPIGCALVDHPLAAKVAASLQVDYAKAFRGFVRKQGRAVPDLRGIVVAAGHADMVQLGSMELQEEKDRKAAERRRKAVTKRWEKLVHKALLRVRLRSEYGEGGPAALLGKASSAAGPRKGKHAARGSKSSGGSKDAASGTAEVSARLIDNSAQLSALYGMLGEANAAVNGVVTKGGSSAARAAVDSDEEDGEGGGRSGAPAGAAGEDAAAARSAGYEDFDAASPLGDAPSASSSSTSGAGQAAMAGAGIGPSSREFEEL